MEGRRLRLCWVIFFSLPPELGPSPRVIQNHGALEPGCREGGLSKVTPESPLPSLVYIRGYGGGREGERHSSANGNGNGASDHEKKESPTNHFELIDPCTKIGQWARTVKQCFYTGQYF